MLGCKDILISYGPTSSFYPLCCWSLRRTCDFRLCWASTSSGLFTYHACRKQRWKVCLGAQPLLGCGEWTQKLKSGLCLEGWSGYACLEAEHPPSPTHHGWDSCSYAFLSLCFIPPLIKRQRLIVLLVALNMICRDDLADNSATHLANFLSIKEHCCRKTSVTVPHHYSSSAAHRADVEERVGTR